MRVAFITLGCKVNSYETDAISDLFSKRGAVVVSSKEEFDACIINTCSVTNQATAKSRKLIRSAIKANPNAIIAVMGCYSQMAKDEVAKATIPILFIHGDADTFVPCSMVYELYDACQTEKKLVIVEGAGHVESCYRDAELYEGALREFIFPIMERE